jgi:hypothetical protein
VDNFVAGSGIAGIGVPARGLLAAASVDGTRAVRRSSTGYPQVFPWGVSIVYGSDPIDFAGWSARLSWRAGASRCGRGRLVLDLVSW